MENVHAVFFLLQSVRRKAANGWSGRGSVPRRMGRGKVLSGSRGRGGHFPCNSAEQRLLTCSAAESAPAGVRAGVVCSFVARVRRGGGRRRAGTGERSAPLPHPAAAVVESSTRKRRAYRAGPAERREETAGTYPFDAIVTIGTFGGGGEVAGCEAGGRARYVKRTMWPGRLAGPGHKTGCNAPRARAGRSMLLERLGSCWRWGGDGRDRSFDLTVAP